MRHRKAHRKLGRPSSHRLMMLRNMVTDLFRHERIETTFAKAKELRSFAEKLITLGKRGDLNAKREVLRYVMDKAVMRKLFNEIAPRYRDRKGGYIRIYRTGYRKGDGALLCIVELIPKEEGS
ncbi:MAG: 50S ribosomal protein L17 [Deltaproteobacteria bacterium]|nr:MAG: 50S ribosomal protein L17 [Deltaproteobacteria bacterium]